MSDNKEHKKNWYVMITRPRWEKKIATSLQQKGVENYCPVNKVRRRWNDRYKIVLEPLFRGYVFVRISEEELWYAKTTPGVLNYVYHEKKPAKVTDEEIVSIQKFLNEFEQVDVSRGSWEKGQEARINSGILMDYKGIIIDIINNKARLYISSMDMELSATINLAQLSPI